MRRISQSGNLKLYRIAEHLVSTGQLPRGELPTSEEPEPTG